MKKVIVPGIFLSALAAPLFIEEVQASTNNVKFVQVEEGSVLNMRSGPSANSDVLSTLKKGQEVMVISEENGWSKIAVNGKEGYVSSSFLKSNETSVVKYVSIDSSSTLNVRSTPSTQSNVLTKIKNNTAVDVYSEENGWSKIKVNGIEGYVASKYIQATENTASDENVTPDNTPVVTEQKQQESVTKYVNVSSGSSLNLRTKPSATSSVIVKLAKDVPVTVYSESNGWAKINVYGKDGYVSTQYLSSTKISDTPKEDNSTQQQEIKLVNVEKNSSLNMRKAASKSSTILTKLSAGTKVTVLSESNGWAKIKVNNVEGYVSSEYLTTQDTSTNQPEIEEPVKETEETPQAIEKVVNVLAGSSLNVRSTPSTSGKVLTKLSKDTVVTVMSESNGWSKVKVNNIEGYVSSEFLATQDTSSNQPGTEEPEKETPETPQTIEKVVNVLAGSSLNVRSTPSTSGKILTKLSKDTVVTVVSEANGWSKVKVNNIEGYVSSEYLATQDTSSNQPDTEEPEEETPQTTEKVVNVSAGSSLNVRSTPSTSGQVLTKLSAGTVVTVESESNGWSKIKVNNIEGYVSSEYLMEKGNSDSSNATIEKNYTNYDLTLEEMTTIQLNADPQTDKKYDTYIREDAVAFKSSDPTKGTVLGSGWRLRGGAGTEYSVVSTVSSGKVLTITSKIKGSDGYYWYKVGSSQGWVTASKEDTSYYINPDNFINDSVSSLQFLNLSKKANVNDAEVNSKILAGKGILAGKASSFITAANAYNVNEMYLISHALLETGNGTSTLANGVMVNGRMVYNMYGIGAYDGSAVSSGAQYAYNAGWFSPEAAIIGGARFIAEGYIKSGQNTLYKMRWNPSAADKTGVATHQYATDIAWATKQVNQISNLYSLLSSYTLVYDIPIYKK
ncbi:SH3 domain-containing protein [Bacillus sp. B1-b2]|uniref:SH3 domain-containing protein n=1 Tax=Bacillus sp. B1-b2 TaxID=2653201 RepID=UPI00186A1DAB|nr:SH3 domain-containing protein [Bacillus sp. B1-b2]